MYDFPLDSATAEMDDFFLAFYIVYFLVMMGISVAVYVLQSLSIYTIAKRRGIKKPGLAWVPVANVWTLGCISDQYRYVAKGQVRNKRKWMLGLSIAMWVAYVAFFVAFGAVMVGVAGNALFASDHTELIGGILGMGVTGLAMMGICVAMLVLQYMALYDLYRSCDPNNAVMYLVLSIFVSICQIVFLFLCRNKDLGMPPRKPQPVEPVYMPPQPAAEPWENHPEE